jgi:hypothetical protein
MGGRDTRPGGQRETIYVEQDPEEPGLEGMPAQK